MRYIKVGLHLVLAMHYAIGTLSHRVRWSSFMNLSAMNSRLSHIEISKISGTEMNNMLKRMMHSHGQSYAKCAFATYFPKTTRPNRRIVSHPSIFQRPLTSLSSSKPKIFNVGERVQTEVDGAQYEGFIQSKAKKGGWYSVQIENEDSSGTSIVKKRGSQLSPISIVETMEGISSKKTLNDNPFDRENYEAQPQIKKSISTIPELLDQNLDAPTIINLDECLLNFEASSTSDDLILNRKDKVRLEQCKHFAQFDKWVTFTDLHCAPNSLQTSLHVLSKVHAEAKKRNAGVLFLGDFWHHRGTVRVDCLNAVLNALSEWSCPLIMIPGNHDQVSLGGLEHALTPLQNAFRVPIKDQKDVPGVLIFSQPSKFREALFVPHIRDIATMQSILQSRLSAASSSLFVHADVTGAQMNDLITSTRGVTPSYFPPDIPIYSGHFHKPHVVNKSHGVSIRYVGSPYETTLAEAGQEKALLVLDASTGWKCLEEIPLSIGRRHWRARSIDEVLELQVMNEDNMNDSLLGPISLVNNGDRVVVSVHQQDLQERRHNAKIDIVDGSPGMTLFDAKVKELRAIGASVEIREVKSIPNSSNTKSPINSEVQSDELDWLLVEDLSPFTAWSNYLQNEVYRESMKNTTADLLLKTGNSLLDELGLSDTSKQGDKSNATHLSLVDISVEGFGPFKDSVTYPLHDRGLVLLRGFNRDGGSDSNGSGKSTLAMASLWALTGSIDPRPVQDAKVNDVVHDESKSARATIRGRIDEKEFIISRSKTVSKGSLTFMLDGEDLTKQSVKETQFAIEEHLGADPQTLSRTIFHGQHTINGLLEATDAKLKDELSIIVSMVIWRDAAATARKNGRALSKAGSELDGMIGIRRKDLDIMEQKRDNADDTVATKSQVLVALEKDMIKRLGECASVSTDNVNIDVLQQGVNEAAKAVQIVEKRIEGLEVEMQVDLKSPRTLLESAQADLNSEQLLLQDIKRQFDRNEVLQASALEHLESLKSRWNVDDSNLFNFDAVSICPTCKQDITNDESHQHLKKEVENDVSDALSRVEKLNISGHDDRRNLVTKQEVISNIQKEIHSISQHIHDLESRWLDRQRKLQLELKDARILYSNTSQELSDAAKRLELMNESSNMKLKFESELESLKEILDVTIENRNVIANDYDGLVEEIGRLEMEREKLKSETTSMSSIADHFGGRGVQTFLLQNTVHALQLASQSYLDELSDGSLQLKLVLDAGDRILRNASVLKPDGSWKTRPLSSLSGGQWRRCSLALSLGFSDLVARRGRLSSSLLVLDEPLTHLDSDGRDNVGKLLRKIIQKEANEQILDGQIKRIGGLSVSTILIILQDLVAEELSESFDSIDEVVKYKGHSKVVVDEESRVKRNET